MINNKLQIRLRPGQDVFFTADTHFEHRNILTFCNRPWDSVSDMERGLIQNWNDTVTDQDIVFHLGDFTWFDSNTKVKKLCSKLNGELIYLVPGNHDLDRAWREVPDNVSILNSNTQLYIRDWGQKLVAEFTLSHFPLLTWSHREHGAANLHGHLHGCKGPAKDGGINPDINLPFHKNQIDVGVDLWNYRPVSLAEIQFLLQSDRFSGN